MGVDRGGTRIINKNGEDFGNFTPGSVKGRKVNDLNGDGVEDPGEPGLAGWKIKLDGTSLAGDAVHLSTMTLADDPNTPANELGTYSFTNLKPGTYTLSEDIASQPGWK